MYKPHTKILCVDDLLINIISTGKIIVGCCVVFRSNNYQATTATVIPVCVFSNMCVFGSSTVTSTYLIVIEENNARVHKTKRRWCSGLDTIDPVQGVASSVAETPEPVELFL